METEPKNFNDSTVSVSQCSIVNIQNMQSRHFTGS